jgi:hypothetical protein
MEILAYDQLFLLGSYFSIPGSFDLAVSKLVGVGGHEYSFFKLEPAGQF